MSYKQFLNTIINEGKEYIYRFNIGRGIYEGFPSDFDRDEEMKNGYPNAIGIESSEKKAREEVDEYNFKNSPKPLKESTPKWDIYKDRNYPSFNIETKDETDIEITYDVEEQGKGSTLSITIYPNDNGEYPNYIEESHLKANGLDNVDIDEDDIEDSITYDISPSNIEDIEQFVYNDWQIKFSDEMKAIINSKKYLEEENNQDDAEYEMSRKDSYKELLYHYGVYDKVRIIGKGQDTNGYTYIMLKNFSNDVLWKRALQGNDKKYIHFEDLDEMYKENAVKMELDSSFEKKLFKEIKEDNFLNGKWELQR